MRYHFVNTLISFFLLSSSFVFGQNLVKANLVGFLPDFAITGSGITTADYGVTYYKVTYKTTDTKGNQTTASGLVAVPFQPTCDSIPLALYAHGTEMLKTNVPSAANTESQLGMAMASRGFVVAMPDYLGLGDHPGFHPYQHAESEATASVDIMLATLEFMEDSLSLKFSHEVFITGYSQGGHSAMATAKYIQDKNLLGDLPIRALAPMSGAYNMSGRQTQSILNDTPFPFQGLNLFIILAYQEVYGNLFTSYSDILKSPYDVTLPPLYNGTYSTAAVLSAVPPVASTYLTDSFLNDFKADSATKSGPFWKALQENDNYDWTPSFPTKLFYCYADELVDDGNSIDAFNTMKANGATNVTKEDLGNNGHVDCVTPATSDMIEYIVSMKTNCAPVTSVSNLVVDNDLQVYPSPANQYITVALDHAKDAELNIITMNGSVIYNSVLRGSQEINIQNFPNGMYIVQVQSRNKVVQKTFVVNH